MTYVQATAENLKEAYSTVWRHRMLVVLAFGVFMSISVALIALSPRIYRAGASVLIVNGNARNDPTLASPDLPTLATSTGVLSRVEHDLSLGVPLATMKKHLIAKASGVPLRDHADRILRSQPRARSNDRKRRSR